MSNEPTSDARNIETVVEILCFDDDEAVPHGWKIVRLGDVSNVKTGSRNNQDKVESGQYPFFVRSDVVERIDTYSHECEAIIIPGEGGIGSIFHYINGRFELHQRVYKISNFTANMHGKFIYYAMFQYFGTHAMKHTVKATVDSLRLPTFKNFLFPAPQSRFEQHAIAEALSDVDGLLESLESLIAKKRAVKIGTMQQLLTGKTRLPGFSAEWQTMRLGELCPLTERMSFVKGRGLSKSDLSRDGMIPCIHYGELFSYGERITDVLHGTDLEGDFVYSVHNDVLMPTSDVTPNGLATASCLQRTGVILGGGILAIRVSEDILDGVFLAYSIRHHRNQILQLVTGTTVYHLYDRDMVKFKFSVPILEEQRAIAEVLSDMDAEIAMLEQRFDKIRAIKQGAMQQLLTGRIRLAQPL